VSVEDTMEVAARGVHSHITSALCTAVLNTAKWYNASEF